MRYLWIAVLAVYMIALSACSLTKIENELPQDSHETSGVVSASPSDVFEFFKNPANWRNINIFNVEQLGGSRALEDLEVYVFTSSGITSGLLKKLYYSDGYLFVSGDSGGYSYFRIEDVKDPKGKIRNVMIVTNDYNVIPGKVDFYRNPIDGRVYAWYGDWSKGLILDALTGEVVFDEAPRKTTTFMGEIEPGGRFVIDGDGNFWIGTSDPQNPYIRGLYIISPDLSEVREVMDEKIWQVYADSNGNIWVIAESGIYVFLDHDPESSRLIFDSGTTKMWGERLIEYGHGYYFSAKNYFDDPEEVDWKVDFAIYRVDGETFEVERIADKSQFEGILESQFGEYVSLDYPVEISLFVFDGELYVAGFGGSLVFKYDAELKEFELADLGRVLGGDAQISVEYEGHEVLISVGKGGRSYGVIFYNLEGEGDLYVLDQIMTTDELAANDVEGMFYDEESGLIYLSHGINGYTLIKPGKILKAVPFEVIGEENDYTFQYVWDFFKHEGNIYVVGGCNGIYELVDEGKAEPILKCFYGNLEKILYHAGRIWVYFDNWAERAAGYYDFETGKVFGSDENWFYRLDERIPWDGGEYLFDMVGVDEDTVFMGVGGIADDGYEFKDIDYVLAYHYSTNSMEKLMLPKPFKVVYDFTNDGSGNIYAISNRWIFKYDGSSWSVFTDVGEISDVMDSVVVGRYLVVISGPNSYGPSEDPKRDGILIVDLESASYTFIKREEIDLPGVLKRIVVADRGDIYEIWIGSMFGLSEIDVPKDLLRE